VEKVLGTALLIWMALLALKFYHDVRMLKLQLYIADYVFFEDETQAEDYLSGSKAKSTARKKR